MKINFLKRKKQVEKSNLGLYIHIPFCVKKCDYCDFLSAPATEEVKKQYVEALINEINSYKEIAEKYIVKTIFFGGGTPSSLEEAFIEDIVKKIYAVFEIVTDPEITIEVNPGTIHASKLKTYKEIGINRLSFGLQSTDNEELKLLGRIHNFEEFEENYMLAREIGFHNINIDLMSALPNQTIEKWTSTLEKVTHLRPEHISAYSLIIEEGTPFFERYHSDPSLLPSEEVDRKMYELTNQILKKHGYDRYEISNYAKPGFESRHNISYWKRTEYLGIGLGASSFMQNARFHNETDLQKYIENSSNYLEIRKDVERLVESEHMEEFMFLGLRMIEGIKKEDFREIFHTSIETVYGNVIHKLEREGLINSDAERIYLTDRGVDISNYVLSEFLFDDFVRS